MIVWHVVIDMFVGVEWGWQWLYHVLEKDVVILCLTAMRAVISVDSLDTSHATVATMKVPVVTGWFLALVAGDHSSGTLLYKFSVTEFAHLVGDWLL